MALTDPYATWPEYKNVKDKTASDDDLAGPRQLVAVSRLLDRKLGEPYGFNHDATGSPTTRIYAPGDRTAPIASLTGLVVKASSGAPIVWGDVDALVLDTDYELLPLNPLPDHPWTDIKLIGFSSSPPSVWTPQTYMPSDYRLQVTAIHGWPAVPEAIWWATIELTAILRAESPFTTDRINELDTVVSTSPQARAILKSLYQVFNKFPIAVG